jgi:trimeric autotransporter adhesin
MSFVGQNSHPFGENQLPKGVRTLGGLSDANTSNNNLALGSGALSATTASGVVAIGVNAGLNGSNVGNDSVIIGGTETGVFPNSVAQLGCGADNVVIGPSALGGATVFGEEAVVIGASAGYNGVGSDTIMLGRAAGLGSTANLAQKAIFIGDNVAIGTGTFNDQSICVGFAAGTGGSGQDSVAIGTQTKALTQGSVAIGAISEASTQNFTVAIGDSAVAQGEESVSMGLSATTTGYRSIALGGLAKATGDYSVSIGGAACTTAGSGNYVVAIGQAAGAISAPGDNAILIGTDAGQGSTSAVGRQILFVSAIKQEQLAVVTNSILLGEAAQGLTNNSIVINASGGTTTSVASGLVIKPIAVESTVSLENHINLAQTSTGFTQILMYNPSTGEVRAVDQPTIP